MRWARIMLRLRSAEGFDPAPAVETLTLDRRLVEVRIAGQPMVAVAEDVPRLRDGLGVPVPPGVAASFTDVVAELTPLDANGQPQVKITTLQEARIPAAPVSPKVPLNLALGALIGLALGVAVSVLRSTLDTRIRGEREARAAELHRLHPGRDALQGKLSGLDHDLQGDCPGLREVGVPVTVPVRFVQVPAH